MCKFYNMNEQELNKHNPESIKNFIKTYAGFYYLNKQGKYIPGIKQSSKAVEDHVTGILTKGIKNPKEVIQILAWKTGRILHAKSQEAFDKKENDFIKYAKGWENSETTHKIKIYSDIDLTAFVEFVPELSKNNSNDNSKIFKTLFNNPPEGIGSVYLITMLYFISKGVCPIYDKYVDMALTAIQESKKPGDDVIYEALPDKINEEKVCLRYKKFIEKFELVFGEKAWLNKDGTPNRNIDRALWVYGHLFREANSK